MVRLQTIKYKIDIADFLSSSPSSLAIKLSYQAY